MGFLRAFLIVAAALLPVSIAPHAASAGQLAPAAASHSSAMEDCSWAGTWGTAATEEGVTYTAAMVLEQDGATVIGGYAYLEDQTTGTLIGNVEGSSLKGTWMEGEDTGNFVLSMAPDCSTFFGTWGNGKSFDDGGVWAGAKA